MTCSLLVLLCIGLQYPLSQWTNIPDAISGIYVLTNTVNGKEYVGQTVDTKIRMRRYATSDTDGQPKIDNALRKYGPNAFTFTVLTETNNADDLNNFETEAIIAFDTKDNGYNCDYGGYYSNRTLLTKEQIESVLSLTLKDAGKKLGINKKTLNRECHRWFGKRFVEISNHSCYTKEPITIERLEAYRDTCKSTAQIAKEFGCAMPTVNIKCHELLGIPVATLTGFVPDHCKSLPRAVMDKYNNSGIAAPVAARELGCARNKLDSSCMEHYGTTFAKHSGCYSTVKIEPEWIYEAKEMRLMLKEFLRTHKVKNNQVHYFIQSQFGCSWRELMKASESKPLAA